MSVIVFFAPMVVPSWAMLTGMAAAAGVGLGYRVATERDAETEAETENEVELEVKNSELVSEGMSRQSEFSIVKGDVKVTFMRNARGQLAVHVKGAPERSEEELQQFGREVVDDFLQRYAYQKVVNELKQREFEKVEESVDKQGRIRIRLRKWEQ